MKNQADAIKTFITQNVETNPSNIVNLTMEKFKVTRPTVHRPPLSQNLFDTDGPNMVAELNSRLRICGDYQSFLTGADETSCLYRKWI